MVSGKRQAAYEGLSERAVDILRLLAQGLSDREIADRVVMTINTVKWYNRQIYSILGVGSRTQAIARARELHLLDEHTSIKTPPLPFLSPPKDNLPGETTRFIGRSREAAEVRRLLLKARLLTLTGPPGTGKTRLSLHVARQMADPFPQGRYFVPLAPISDPMLVADAIASAIGIGETPGKPLIQTLKHYLSEKHLLLVLDNFEHLLPAAPIVSELLMATSNLRVLATSREALHLYGEQEYAVPLLELPNQEHVDISDLASCDSVALFIERARSVQPELELTTENALDVTGICLRLEGLPLAIELAAARVKLLPPKSLLARLDSRLDVLTGGPRDLPPRQQTLRRTIGWSYDLLNSREKRLFARLAVFRGGRSVEAVEAVCGPGLLINALEGIESLLNKSLLLQQVGKDGEPRFVMLEIVHEYAWEQLEAFGEERALRTRHAHHFLGLAEQAEPQLRTSGFPLWMARLDADSENLRSALEWSLLGGDIELGLRLASALADYWVMSSRYIEGTAWMERALAKLEGVAPNLRARVLIAAGNIYNSFNQQSLGNQCLEEAVAIARETNDRRSLAWALTFLGAAGIVKSPDYEPAIAVTEEGLAMFRELGDKPGMAQALNIIGELARINGDNHRAQAAYEECLLLVRETGEKRREGLILGNLGQMAMSAGDAERAEHLIKEGLIKMVECEYDRRMTITFVISLACVLGARGQEEQAVRLMGAGEALFEPLGVGLQPSDLPDYDHDLAVIRSRLDPARFEACWNEGRAMSLDEAVAYALTRDL